MKRETVTDRERFEQLHKEGSEKYGTDWLVANNSATQILQSLGYPPSMHKLLGTLVAMRLLEWYSHGKMNL
jgi:hypothetical protein